MNGKLSENIIEVYGVEVLLEDFRRFHSNIVCNVFNHLYIHCTFM
jgi:hypothetical protein